MKKSILAIVTLFLSLLMFSNTALGQDPIETGTFNNKAIYGFDTVSYFTQNKAVKGDDKITYDWRGAQWHFSTEQNKTLFAADPEKYAPQYGGYCAYAMSRGRFVGVDEEAFTIYNGKLYLNYSKSVMKDWREDKDNYINAANGSYEAEVDL